MQTRRITGINIRHREAVAHVDFVALRMAIAFEQRSVRVFGKVHPQPRLTAWYGPCAYTYSGLTLAAQPMPRLIERLRMECVQRSGGVQFNSVLCNLYRDGSDTVGWHADDEPLFGGDPVVASMSFGASRRFCLKHREAGERRNYVLNDGSLLVMGRGVQREWLHSVPRTKRKIGARINLTFRRVV